jgi:hypothetical protein
MKNYKGCTVFSKYVYSIKAHTVIKTKSLVLSRNWFTYILGILNLYLTQKI